MLKLPHSECTLPVKISFSANSAPLVDDSVLLEPTVALNQENLIGSKCLSSVDHGFSAYRVLNPTNYPVFLKEDFVIATSHLVDEQNIQQVTDHDEQASVNLLDASVENESEIHYKNIAKDLGFNLDNSELSARPSSPVRQDGERRTTFLDEYAFRRVSFFSFWLMILCAYL